MPDDLLTEEQQDEITANVLATRQRIAHAAESNGHDPAAIELLAITKTWPISYHRAAHAAGCRLLGESRQQEALEKIPLLPSNIQWHFIGHLQRNKIRKTLPHFPTVHAIDSLKLATAVDRVAEELGLHPKVYLQVNLAQESAKYGFTKEQLAREIDQVLDLPRLHIEGLMCIPPAAADPEETRPYFQELRHLRRDLQEQTGIPLPGLSMGMSHDYEIAAQEGSTIVRVGSALFGKRSKKSDCRPQ